MSHAAHACNRHFAALVLTAAMTGWCATAVAQEAAPARPTRVLLPEHSLAQLEQAFWACDYAATTSGIVDMHSAVPCGMATEDLQHRKFAGDFDALLAWWRQNKPAQHGALDSAYRAARLR